MPVVDYMTQGELWCIMSFKCALVEKKTPPRFQTKIRVTKSNAMCRNQMKGVDSAYEMVYVPPRGGFQPDHVALFSQT